MLFFIGLFIAILGFGAFASYCRHSPNFRMWVKGALGLTVLIVLLAFGHAAKPAPASGWFYTDDQGRNVGSFPTWEDARADCISRALAYCNGTARYWTLNVPDAAADVLLAPAPAPAPAPPQAERTDVYEQSLRALLGEQLTPLN